MNIALKEAKETMYWLKLLEQWFDELNNELQKECEEIAKILVTIIKDTKTNRNK